jgi:predicted DNA-binding protein
MPVTTIRLPARLKERVAALVKSTGTSMHAFMVEAIEQQTLNAERHKRFLSEARAARKEALRSGVGYVAEEVHAYLDGRLSGKKVPRPKAKRWRG